MLSSILNVVALACYLAGGALLLVRLLRPAEDHAPTQPHAALWLTAIGLAAHATVLKLTLFTDEGLNLALNSSSSLMTAMIVALYLAVSAFRPIVNLGIFLLPLAALAVLLAWIWPGDYILIPRGMPLMTVHFVVAFVAYSLLALAMLQALLVFWQENRLRHRYPGRLLRALPPLQTMEHLMFQLIAAGFSLLTITLISGTMFAEAVFGRPLVFTHHVVLAILAWVTFAVLLLGHWRFGWRGRNAVRWTVGGFALLVLAYFGSKFVFEILLGR
jgi:ABC-type uncharacterized transport system permease subunit